MTKSEVIMLEKIAFYLTGIAVPVCLLSAGLFYSVRLGFFHVLHPRYVLKGIKSKGGGSPARAAALALAGTFGVGNIVGVSSAIYLGGFGAVFWMWISALIAMILKYAEIVLSLRHKRASEGSAMYYIYDFLRSAGFRRLALFTASVFAVIFLVNSFTMGSMLQANAVSEALGGAMGIPAAVSGALLTAVTFLVIRRGTSGITSLTNILVPIMSAGYAVLALAVIIKNSSELPNAFRYIFSSAFSARSAVGGIGGFTFISTVRYGVMRGLVSNEAGCGTAPTAHALAQNTPSAQGMWGIFEVFADTVVLCTLTALAVILEYDSVLSVGGNYMLMTLCAFESALGAFAPYFIAVSVFCFGLATIACWAHYGLSCVRYLSGRKQAAAAFSFIYCLCVLYGSFAPSERVWLLSDIAMGIMTLINLFVTVGMSGEVKKETEEYLQSIK